MEASSLSKAARYETGGCAMDVARGLFVAGNDEEAEDEEEEGGKAEAWVEE